MHYVPNLRIRLSNKTNIYLNAYHQIFQFFIFFTFPVVEQNP